MRRDDGKIKRLEKEGKKEKASVGISIFLFALACCLNGQNEFSGWTVFLEVKVSG